MKLFTGGIDKKLFAQFPKGSDLKNQKVIAKIFNPFGRGTWYIINSDPNDPDYLWAIVDLYETEVGSVSRKELESVRIKPFNLKLERDMYFDEVNAQELYDGLLEGKRYAKGGYMEDDDESDDMYDSVYEINIKEGKNKVPYYIVRDKIDGEDVGIYESLEDAQNWIKSKQYGFAKGGYMAKGGVLKEGDYVWNAVGKKLVVNKVTNDEYYLSAFGQIGDSPFSKQKVEMYLKNGQWSRTPKMADGGQLRSYKTFVEEYPDKKIYVRVKFAGADKDVQNYTANEENKKRAISFAKRLAEKNNGTYEGFKIYTYAKGGYMAKGGIVVTSIKDIPNFEERLNQGRITYRGLGVGKLSNDFYNIAGEGGKMIKVDGKEYYITDTEFNSFSRDADGMLRVKFAAPKRKFERGGYMARGGQVEFLYSDSNFDNKYYKRFNGAIGSFAWIYEKRYNEGILYPLDAFDLDYYAHLPLKENEVILRYQSDRMRDVDSSMYLIKFNVKKMLVYFMEDAYSDDDKNIKFSPKGLKLEYLTIEWEGLSSKQQMNIDLDKFDKGGTLSDYDQLIGKTILIYSMGVKTPNSYKISGVKPPDPRFSIPTLMLEVGSGAEYIEGREKIANFLKGNQIEMNDGGEYYAIELVSDSKSKEHYAKGGQTPFEKLSNKVADNYEGKKVPNKYQKLYGKTYNRSEAKEVGDKVAAKVYRLQLKKKMAKGGEILFTDKHRND